ncbi:DUF4367 domain-containing protein [Dorea sp. AF36-15AT]|uniref:DUF4367 domain-containing protein n=1 Tax=Dorea sp. AF36-15AT TaxID=2292041 RepID=UPI000E544BE2|nr:DUF4367 domain-containing protein [Dorea sp. AF36-15AT]RHP06345.1 DUF4367 domain-containing protein [Dorea sp. AF36-15AT]
MKEHLNDYEKRIWEGIDKDAEEIIKMVEADPEAMSAEPSEEMERKIYAMIPGHEDADSEDSAMEGLSEEDQEALRLGRELQKRRKEKEEEKSRAKRRHHRKRITAAAAVLVLVIGIGTTGVGGPKRIVEMVEQAVGDRQVSKVNNSKKRAKTIDNEAEEQAYQEIRDQLGFDPVRVVRFDENMKYSYCEIDEDMEMAQLLYKNGSANVSYVMSSSYYEELIGVDLEDAITDSYTLEKGKLKAKVMEYELPESKKKRYSATFEYQGVYYQLIGTIEKADFEEILKKLHFPS